MASKLFHDRSRQNSKLHLSEIKKTKHNNVNSVHNHPDVYFVAEYVKDKLFFAVLHKGKYEPQTTPDIDFFSIDDELIYVNFYDDFGPLNLGCLYKYCWKVNKKLKYPCNRRKQIVHYTTKNEEQKANAAYLMASYALLYLNKNPKDAYKPLIEGNLAFKPFRDATVGISNYNIRLQDCLNALLKAATFRFFDFEDFNLSEYEKYEKLENGDLNWIVPQKIIAFIGPNAKSTYHTPEHYFEYFLKNNITAVIRLNSESYDASKFTKLGIDHYDMFIPDGGIPSRIILNQFLQVAETAIGAIAVHCRAGLGRTGSLICAYLIKHYKMTAREAIAWTRICRPGSVIGHQQAWLENIQKELWQAGQQYRLKHYGDVNLIVPHKRGIYSIVQKLESRSSGNYLKHKDNDRVNYNKEENETSSTCKSQVPELSCLDKIKKIRHINVFDKILTFHGEKTNDVQPKDLPKRKKYILDIHQPTDLSDSSQGDRLNNIKTKRNKTMKLISDKNKY